MSVTGETGERPAEWVRPKLTPEQKAAAKKLKDDSTGMVDRLADRLTSEDVAKLRELLFVGEFDLLADLLAAKLSKRGVPITAEERDAMYELLQRSSSAHAMANYWYIANRDEVVATFNVVDEPGGAPSR